MYGLNVTSSRPVVYTSSFGRGWPRVISHELPQVLLLDQIRYLILQLKIVFCVVAMIFMKNTIFVLISPKGIGLDLPRPLHKFLIFDLHRYLGNGGIERW